MSKYIRELSEQLAELTDRPIQIKLRNGNHIEIVITGLSRKFFTSSTPSDHRSRKNLISSIKQQFRLDHLN